MMISEQFTNTKLVLNLFMKRKAVDVDISKKLCRRAVEINSKCKIKKLCEMANEKCFMNGGLEHNPNIDITSYNVYFATCILI